MIAALLPDRENYCMRKDLTRNVTYATVFLAFICLLDAAVTLYAVRSGYATEANPLLRPFIQMGDGHFLLVKGFSFLVPLCIIELLRHKKPKFINRALTVGAVSYPSLFAVGSWMATTNPIG